MLFDVGGGELPLDTPQVTLRDHQDEEDLEEWSRQMKEIWQWNPYANLCIGNSLPSQQRKEPSELRRSARSSLASSKDNKNDFSMEDQRPLSPWTVRVLPRQTSARARPVTAFIASPVSVTAGNDQLEWIIRGIPVSCQNGRKRRQREKRPLTEDVKVRWQASSQDNSEALSSSDSSYESEDFEEQRDRILGETAAVRQGVTLDKQSVVPEDEDEQVFAQHGTVEEYFVRDPAVGEEARWAGDAPSLGDVGIQRVRPGYPSVDPFECLKETTANTFFDELWCEMIPLMRPLLEVCYRQSKYNPWRRHMEEEEEEKHDRIRTALLMGRRNTLGCSATVKADPQSKHRGPQLHDLITIRPINLQTRTNRISPSSRPASRALLSARPLTRELGSNPKLLEPLPLFGGVTGLPLKQDTFRSRPMTTMALNKKKMLPMITPLARGTGIQRPPTSIRLQASDGLSVGQIPSKTRRPTTQHNPQRPPTSFGIHHHAFPTTSATIATATPITATIWLNASSHYRTPIMNVKGTRITRPPTAFLPSKI